jgi:hypothetical protein
MRLSWVFYIFLGILSKVTAQQPNDEDKPKVKNPYFTKFQESAHLRPTKCQGNSKNT